MKIKDNPREFIEGTLLLLEKELKATFLLNCLFGLIVTTYEQLDQCTGDFFKKRLFESDVSAYIPKKISKIDLSGPYDRYKEKTIKKPLVGQVDVTIENIVVIDDIKLAMNLTLKEFIRNIRNGLAHQNIIATTQSNHWEGVRIWNDNKYGIKDFEVEFKIGQLKKFAAFIGKKFIEQLPERIQA